MDFVYKIFTKDEWNQFSKDGVFKGNPDDIRDGFIHLCNKEQLDFVLNKFFKDRDDLEIKKLSTESLRESLKWEGADDQLFPHYYADLKIEWIIS
jgi:uncharacterized protein (DUF952 family)